MPVAGPYYLNPNAGFNPSTSQQSTGQGPVGSSAFPGTKGGPVYPAGVGPSGLPRPKGGPVPFTPLGPDTTGGAVRPTDQGGPQAAWMQNLATFAGGGLAGSQQGPVRRLVDVLGVNPYGQDNPMTLLMQALQSSQFGLGMPNTGQPAQSTAPQYYPRRPMWPPNQPVGVGMGAPSQPAGFNPIRGQLPF